MLFLEENERLDVLQTFEVLNENDRKEFDEISTLARLICLTPVCMITILGREKEIFLSTQGIPESEDPLDFSLCRMAVRGPRSITVIRDLLKDFQLKTHPSVIGDPGLRFYAGVPILTREKQLMGTICVLDYKPGALTEHQQKALRILANRAMKQIELRKIVLDQKRDVGSTYEKLHTITSQIPDFIITLDRQLRITYVNRISALKAASVLKQEAVKFIHDDYKAEFIDNCIECFDTLKIVENEFRAVTSDLERRWFSVKFCPLKSNEGAINSIMVIAHDITLQKTQQMRLEHNEDRYRDIVENTADMIQIVDVFGNILFVNKSWLSTFGFEDFSDVAGRNVLEFVNDEYIHRARTIFDGLKQGKNVSNVEMVFNDKDGNRIICSGNVDCSWEDGHITYMRGIFRNITAQRIYESTLVKNQFMLNKAQKISKTGSFECNLVTGQVIWSDEMFDLLGISKQGNECMLMQDLYKLVHKDDQEKTILLMEDAGKMLQDSHIEFRIVTPKGTVKYIDGKGSPFTIKDNRVKLILFTMQDITELRNFEKKIFNAAVQSEEKERTRMAGELHDGVCQYLASANLMLDIMNGNLKEDPENWDIDQIRQLLEYSRTGIKEGLNLVRKVSHDLYPTEFHRSGFIDSVKYLVGVLNTTGGMSYNLSISGEYKERNTNVSINLFRIIQEFTRNSQKYSEGSKVDIVLRNSDDLIDLYIADDGKGFTIRKNDESHKGIGLLSMKNRIESIGGTFDYKTAPGKGVQLILRLPVQ